MLYNRSHIGLFLHTPIQHTHLLIVTMAEITESNPATPATRSGKRYVQSSADEGERRTSKLPVRISIPGTSSARRSAQALAEKKAAKRRNSTSGALSAQVPAEVAEEAPMNPTEPKQFEDHGAAGRRVPAEQGHHGQDGGTAGDPASEEDSSIQCGH